jgi:hypothetical protein
MRAKHSLAPLLLALAPAALSAQTAVSLQAGAMAGEYASAFEVGVRVSPARPNSVGLGFSFDAVPQTLSVGALVGLTDLSVAGNIGLARDLRLELRAGGSALVGIGGGGVGALGGYHVGGGVVFQGMGPVGLRVDYTYRRLRLDGESLSVPSFTLGLVLHH